MNGEIILVDYIFLSKVNIYEDEENAKVASFNEIKLFNENLNLLNKKINFVNEDNSIDKFNSKIKGNLYLNENKNYLSWNYNYNEEFKCRVDDINKVNVYYFNSLLPEDK